MSIRDTIDTAIGAVISNASNFPQKAQTRILGQDMAPLRERLTNAVIDALSHVPTDPTQASTWSQGYIAGALAGADDTTLADRGCSCDPREAILDEHLNVVCAECGALLEEFR